MEELKSRKDYYPIERCIEVVEQRKKKLPLAYLLMRNGLFKPAIGLYMEVLREVKLSSSDFLSGTTDFLFGGEHSKFAPQSMRGFDGILGESFTICDLGSKQLNEEEQVEIWFSVIEALYELRG